MKTVSLLREVYTPNAEVIREGTATYLEGVFMEADIKNNNNRMYPLKILMREAAKLQDMISERRLLGELDHPDSLNINLERVAIRVMQLESMAGGGQFKGRVEILPTPKGQIAEALVKAGVPLAISSRGVGSLSEGIEEGTQIVGEDYKLITFDVVHSPGAPNAFLALKENLQYVVEGDQYYPVFRSFPTELQQGLIEDEELAAKDVIKYIESLRRRVK